MMRSITLAIVLATAIAAPALAQSTVVTPPAATAPTTGATAPTAGALATTPSITLTAEQAKSWVNKPIYSSDGTNIGEVAAFARGTDDKVSEMHADIGGYFGLGETRVRLMPAQFKLAGDRATINMTAAQAKDLPRVK
ncbi:MAG: hypothetical protein SH859_02740 [Hyphomicrobium aestuarii]|nr:hypothetical protein [Hyphomicrobium aestuarii]